MPELPQRTDDDLAELESIAQEIMAAVKPWTGPGGYEQIGIAVREVLARRVRVAEVAARATEAKTPPDARTDDLCPASVWPYTENNMCVLPKGHGAGQNHRDAKDREFTLADYVKPHQQARGSVPRPEGAPSAEDAIRRGR